MLGQATVQGLRNASWWCRQEAFVSVTVRRQSCADLYMTDRLGHLVRRQTAPAARSSWGSRYRTAAVWSCSDALEDPDLADSSAVGKGML